MPAAHMLAFIEEEEEEDDEWWWWWEERERVCVCVCVGGGLASLSSCVPFRFHQTAHERPRNLRCRRERCEIQSILKVV